MSGNSNTAGCISHYKMSVFMTKYQTHRLDCKIFDVCCNLRQNVVGNFLVVRW